MESITNHDVYLSGHLMYILLKNLDVNISDTLDASMYNSLDAHVQPLDICMSFLLCK